MRPGNYCGTGLKILLLLAAGCGQILCAQAQKPANQPIHPKSFIRPAQTLPTPRRIHKLYSVHFPIVSRLQFFDSGESCDANGNLYLMTGIMHSIPGVPIAPPDLSATPVTRLDLSNQDMTKFRPQGFLDSQDYLPTKFTVDDEGNLYRLFMPNSQALGRHPDNLIVEYDSDGSYDSKVKIHAPHGMALYVANFAVFADGNYLIIGTIQPPWHPKPGAKLRIVRHPIYPPGLRPFTGIFDGQGERIATVLLPHDISFSKKYPYHSLPGLSDSWNMDQLPTEMINATLVARGPNDTVYLMRPAAQPILYTISDAGQLLHQVNIVPLKANHLLPDYMKALGHSRLLIEYIHSWYDLKDHNFHNVMKLAINNVITGKIENIYHPKPKFNTFICAFGNNIESTGITHSGQLEVNVYSLSH